MVGYSFQSAPQSCYNARRAIFIQHRRETANMENIDFNIIAQMAPAVLVLIWLVYRQQMQIERLETRCLERPCNCDDPKEEKDGSRVP